MGVEIDEKARDGSYCATRKMFAVMCHDTVKPAPGRSDEDYRLESVALTGLTNQADETMDRLAGLAARVLGSTVALVSLVDESRQFFPGQIGLDFPLSQRRETPLSESFCQMVVNTGSIVQIDDTAASPEFVAHNGRTVLGVESYLGAPLVDASGRVLGSLCAIEPRARAWTDEERQILADLAFGASSALRARIAVSEANLARADAELARQRLQLMADVSTALNSTMDPETSIHRMLDIVVGQMANWALVFIRADGESPERTFVRHHDIDLDRVLSAGINGDESVGDAVILRDFFFTRTEMDQLGPHLLNDSVDRPQTVDNVVSRLGLGSTIVVPMTLGQRVVGAVALVGSSDQRAYDQLDVTLVGDLARRAAMTFDHARIYAREKRIAFELQHSLLPELPTAEQLQVGAVYAPASTGVEVGGDWYDLVDLPDGSFVACIGDVTGHNIRAAAAMGRVQVALRSFAFAGHAPDEILNQVSDNAKSLLGDLLATCLVVGLTPQADGSWQLTVANAGHLPPLLRDPGGDARFIEIVNDPLLGFNALNRPARATTTMTVASGSTLVLYTDGLIERRGEIIDVGLERLRSAGARLSESASIHDLCEHLVTEVEPDGRDDVALIAIRV